MDRKAALLSLALFAATALVLLGDLGRPLRFWKMLGSFNVASPMSAGVRLLVAEATLTFIFWWLLRRRAEAIEGGDEALAPGATAALFDLLPRALWLLGLLLALYPAWLLSGVWVAPLAKGPTSYAAFTGSALSLGMAVFAALAPPRHSGAAQGRALSLLPVAAALLVVAHAVALGLGGSVSAALVLAALGSLPLFALVRPAATWWLSLISGASVRALLVLGAP